MYAALLKVDFDMLAHTRTEGQSAAHRREDVNTSSMSVQGGRMCEEFVLSVFSFLLSKGARV